MARVEIKTKENPYELSKEELTCPDKDIGKWFEGVVAQQREGIKYGFKPKNLRYPTPNVKKRWIGRVWNYYLGEG